MALIKCPECGREVSSFADSCNYCGHPIKGGAGKSAQPFGEEENKISSEEAKRFQVKEKKSGGRRVVIAVISIVLFVLWFIGRMANEQAAVERRRQEEINKSFEEFEQDIQFEDIFTPAGE